MKNTEKTEIAPDNFANLFSEGAFDELNPDLKNEYDLSSEELKYINSGSYNIVFEFLGIDGKTEGFRPLIFRVSKSPFYQHKIEPETAEVSTLSRIKNYLPSYFSSQPQTNLAQLVLKNKQTNLAQQELTKKQTNTTYNELKEQIGESVPSFFKEKGKSHGRAYLEHLSREKIIPELISMDFFVLRLDGHFCFYEYSISEKGIVLKEYLRDNPTLTENDIKTLCEGIQNILMKLVRLHIEFDIRVDNFVVVKDLSGPEPKYVPRIIDVEISQISQSSGLASSLPSIELKLREMFTQDKVGIEQIYKFIVMFQLFQLSLNFKQPNHKRLEDFPILSNDNIEWYLKLWENNEINIISKYIENMLFYFYFFFSTFYKFIFTKKQENKVFIMNEMTYPNCFNNYPYYIKNLINKNFNTEGFIDYYNKPLEKPVPTVNNGGSRTKKTKRVRKNKSKKRKNKSKKRKLII